MSYRVCHTTHGVYTIGPVPIGEIVALMEEWSERYPIADALIAQHLGASMVLTNDSDAWRDSLGILEPNDQEGIAT